MHIGVSFTYFNLTISYHNSSSFSNIHHHLHRRLIFINLRFFIPRPPFSCFIDFRPLYQVIFLFDISTLPKEFSSKLVHSFNISVRDQEHGHIIDDRVQKTRVD
jgi:hypothetical protein